MKSLITAAFRRLRRGCILDNEAWRLVKHHSNDRTNDKSSIQIKPLHEFAQVCSQSVIAEMYGHIPGVAPQQSSYKLWHSSPAT